jgi:DNA-3-methyladenine glycosylase II
MEAASWKSDHALDLQRCVARNARWGDDPANRVVDGTYVRVVGGVPYRATQRDDGTIVIEALSNADACLEDLKTRVSDAAPIEPIEALAASDPVIGGLWRQARGYRPPRWPDPVEALATSITAQQVNLTWATETRARLIHMVGRRHEISGTEVWEFPTGQALASAPVASIRELQFTWRKAESLVGVGEAAADGYFEGIEAMDDEAVVAHLVALKGIGRWSADWYLARGLGRPWAVAAGDLGVRKAVGTIYLGNDGPVSEDDVRSVAAEWGDAANWATHLLLEALG